MAAFGREKGVLHSFGHAHCSGSSSDAAVFVATSITPHGTPLDLLRTPFVATGIAPQCTASVTLEGPGATVFEMFLFGPLRSSDDFVVVCITLAVVKVVSSH